MKAISIFNNKGGVGKTTLTFHLAFALAEMGKKTLIIDLDPQCNLTIFGVDEESLPVESKESFYTSIHYLVRPRKDSDICCEIQVRTLFEEIWGEVDHSLNYPYETSNIACREQILVLAKLVGAGSRLVDAIFRSHDSSKLLQLEEIKKC